MKDLQSKVLKLISVLVIGMILLVSSANAGIQPGEEPTQGIMVFGDERITGDLVVDGDLWINGTLWEQNPGNGNGNGNGANITYNFSAVTNYNYLIYDDEYGNIYALNGYTGVIDFESTDADQIIQTTINAVEANTGVGILYIRKSVNPTLQQVPRRFTLSVDYSLDTTIQVPDAISIMSNGVIFDVTNLDGTVFYLNPGGEHYALQDLYWVISGISFVGSASNVNTCAIHVLNWANQIIIDNINTVHVAYAVRLEGSVYRTVIQNCFFGYGAGYRGQTAIRMFRGRGLTGTNAVTVFGCDISSYNVGISVEGGYGIKIAHNYFEGNTQCIYAASSPTIVGNYFQSGRGRTGIYVTGTPTITGNYFMLDTNSIGIHAGANYGQITITGNEMYAGNGATFLYSNTEYIYGTITSNNCFLSQQSSFIDARLGRSTVGNNRISGGYPAINQRGSNAIFVGNTFYYPSVGIVINGYYNQISNNYFSGGSYGVILAGRGNVVKDNFFSGVTTEINIISGSHTIQQNIGYVTENSGTSTVSNGAWVSHGLVSTPSIVILTPRSNANVWVISRNQGQFQVGVSSGTVTIDWYVKVG